VHKLIEFAEETFGSVAVLVNNASEISHVGDQLEYWRETIETHFIGTMHGIRAAIDAMRRTVARDPHRPTMPPRPAPSG
jgi:NAD(P)-dependent dehydrogenase (short-subunit alcohol dehydrogenase family)